MARPHPRQSARHRIEYDERDREIVMAYRSGKTQMDIAVEYGIARTSVETVIKRAMDRAREELFTETEIYRALNLERLGALLSASWPQAMAGDVKAIDAARRIVSEISRLTGANEAVRIEIGESDVDRTLRQLDQLLNQRATEAERQAAAGPIEA